MTIRHIKVSVTVTHKSIRLENGDIPKAKGVDLGAALKRLTVSAIFGWIMKEIISYLFSS